MLIHLTEYVKNICRKGMLERAAKEKFNIGKFKQIESDYMKRASNDTTDIQKLLAEMYQLQRVLLFDQLKTK